MRKLALLVTVAVGSTLAGCGGSSGPCDGVTGTCTILASGTAEADIQTKFNTAVDGQTFAFAAGTFSFTRSLVVTNKNITIKGAGMTQTILDFHGLTGTGIGIDASTGHTDNFTVVDLTVQDTPKNGIKAANAIGVTFRRVAVGWTNKDPTTHGDYALYPVFCQKVLVENCDIAGSSDAGIYVGQSSTIVVRNNKAHDNVAGIEIENSISADVYGNTATNNTGGILVFDLPGSGNQHDGHNVHVYNNQIITNNTTNFNGGKSTVALVPAGTGTFVLATRDVEVDHNTFSGNKTTAFSVISYAVPGQGSPSGDPLYDPGISKRVYVHDNTFTSNGVSPDVDTHDQLGSLLALKLGSYPASHVPDLIVDGVNGAAYAGAPPGNPNGHCFMNNTSTTSSAVTFMNMHFDQYLANVAGGGSQTDTSSFDFSATAVTNYACTIPALPAVATWF
jgi:parallel beta-helix repeat protein